MSFYGFGKYVSVGEKRAKAEKKLKQLKKKNPDIRPIIVEGQALAKTWWGKAWNKNLERYADYSNRIGRGRSYVRHRAVLDLQITPGRVDALVMGSGSKPYSVTVTIKPIPTSNWSTVKQNCRGKLDSLQKLIGGKFPKELENIFTQEKNGLFPVPTEINFDCSCPDWADMCKHVAATLYGIGARLDEDPSLFFVLRKVDVNDLISQTVKESKKELLGKAVKKSSRILQEDSGLSDIFGIDLGDGIIDKPKSLLKKESSLPQNPTTAKQLVQSNKSTAKITAIAQIESGSVVGGFGHNQTLALKDKIIEAVKSGAIKRFVVMAGCDGRHRSREYYTKVAQQLPQDAVILTAGCAKYKYLKLDLGDIDGIPRVLDAGQCNDSYSLAVIALELQNAFGLDDINDLPLSFDIAWYEQKAVLVLLALLSLGVKGIRLGPTLPGFLSPNVAKILVEAFDIKAITTPEEDVAAMMAGH